MKANEIDKLISDHLVSSDMSYNTIRYDISFIVLTYNPDILRLYYTLESLLIQKETNFEIIVSDDGSEDNLYSSVVALMNRYCFSNYKLIDHHYNQGTVRNSYDAIKLSESQYIKMISPGDALVDDHTISNWLKYIREEAAEWSFGNSIYYKYDNHNNKTITNQFAYPQLIDCYRRKLTNVCRWNYVVLNDYVLGASTLIKRELMIRYLTRILDRVIYGEDTSFWMMMFENILPAYYDKSVVMYEYGVGISTCGNSIWTERLMNDWNNAADILFVESQNTDSFQKKMMNAYYRKYPRNRILRWILKLFRRGYLLYFLKVNIKPRLTPSE